MKKKPLFFFLLILMILMLTLLLTGIRGGNVRHVRREVGSSEKYTSAEIENAMDIVQRHFKAEFQGCRLLTLTYDESHSDKFCEDWAVQYAAEEAIILLSSFAVNASGGDGSFTPNETYGNWQWILTRDGGDNWILRTWGYG